MTEAERRAWREAHGCDRNKTAHDAYQRIRDARLGAFVDATDDYLMNLSHELLEWNQEIQREFALRNARAKAAEELEGEN